jgi:dynein heavy chain
MIKKSLDHLTEALEMYRGGDEDSMTKLKMKPFMTLNVSVVGQHDLEIESTSERSDIYEIEEDDPDILAMVIAFKYKFLTYFWS